MIILAFDSTAKIASVAVTEDNKLLGQYNIDNGLTQSELLLPMADNLLKSLRLSYSDIDLITASAGPGSFTGVRIGVSLAKGIAFSKGIPCVSVSTLEALAENITPLSGILVPAMDARRGQVYNAIFRSNGETSERLTPDRAISAGELAEELRKFKDEAIYVSGDGYELVRTALIGAGIKVMNTPSLLIAQNAYSCAIAALKKYNAGEVLSDSELSPTYLRLPQAERERLEKEKTK